jgi:hypothetical protein
MIRLKLDPPRFSFTPSMAHHPSSSRTNSACGSSNARVARCCDPPTPAPRSSTAPRRSCARPAASSSSRPSCARTMRARSPSRPRTRRRVTCCRRSSRNSTTSIRRLPCFRWHRAIVVPHGHPLGETPKPTFEEFGKYPLITYSFSFTGPASLLESFAEAGVTPNVAPTACSCVNGDIPHFLANGDRAHGVRATSTVTWTSSSWTASARRKCSAPSPDDVATLSITAY